MCMSRMNVDVYVTHGCGYMNVYVTYECAGYVNAYVVCHI